MVLSALTNENLPLKLLVMGPPSFVFTAHDLVAFENRVLLRME